MSASMCGNADVRFLLDASTVLCHHVSGLLKFEGYIVVLKEEFSHV